MFAGVAPSVAVQDIVVVPSALTETVPVFEVDVLLVSLKAGEQVMLAMPEASVALTATRTGEVMNQPLLPSGVGGVTVSVGAVESLGAGAHAPVSLIVAEKARLSVRLSVSSAVPGGGYPLPDSWYEMVPVKLPGVPPAFSATEAVTLALSMLFPKVSQFDGSRI